MMTQHNTMTLASQYEQLSNVESNAGPYCCDCGVDIALHLFARKEKDNWKLRCPKCWDKAKAKEQS